MPADSSERMFFIKFFCILFFLYIIEEAYSKGFVDDEVIFVDSTLNIEIDRSNFLFETIMFFRMPNIFVSRLNFVE